MHFFFVVFSIFSSMVMFGDCDTCVWEQWSSFTQCNNGEMNRTRNCFCDTQIPENCEGESTMIVQCSDGKTNPFESNKCLLQWGAWSPCSKICGINPPGNTSRRELCFCNGEVDEDTECQNPPRTEVVDCNNFNCNQPRPQNKIYWATLLNNQTLQRWPIPSTTSFTCSKGDTMGFSKLTWSAVLQDAIYRSQPSWHFLSKEYIAARLNLASGCYFNEIIVEILQETSNLLSNCNDFTSTQVTLSLQLKEKLSRFNNGIGGISKIEYTPQFDHATEKAANASRNLAAAVILGVTLFGVILGAIGYILVKRRKEQKKLSKVLEKEEFLTSSDEDSVKDERSAEELRL